MRSSIACEAWGPIAAFVRENRVFFSVLALALAYFRFSQRWIYPEYDTLPCAKHLMDPGWLSGDWYLGLGISYRYLFDVVFGLLARAMSLHAVGVVGRFVIEALFAWLVQRVARVVGVRARFAVLVAASYLWLGQSFAHTEKMIHGVSTKSFAYFCAASSLLALVRRRHRAMYVWAGLAVSFHVLIGLDSLLCLAVAAIAQGEWRSAELRRSLRSAWTFFAAGSLGLYAVAVELVDNRGVDRLRASLIYVTFRVPHHTHPAYFEEPRWAAPFVLACALLAVTLARAKTRESRLLVSYALGTAGLFGVGLALYAAGALHLLKYYWFRLGDVTVPFAALFTVFALADRARLPDRARARWSSAAAVAACAAIAVSVVRWVHPASAAGPKAEEESAFRDVTRWIRENTPADATFLINPYTREFYLEAERAQFVSFPHSPQSERDILAWYERMRACNGGASPSGVGFLADAEVSARFYALDAGAIRRIGREYGVGYYLGKPARSDLPELYRNAGYALYRID